MIALKNLKLWWPAWQQGIPITAYGFIEKGKPGAYGEGYRFDVDPELDSWLTEDNKLMPVSTASLILINGIAQSRIIEYTSFSLCGDGKVQINRRNEYNGYIIEKYPIEQLYMDGESYSEDD